MKHIRRELLGPVTALMLLGILARLLAPMPALAAAERAIFGSFVGMSLCLADDPAEPGKAPGMATAAHCPLCRLPDAEPWAALVALALPVPLSVALAPPLPIVGVYKPPPSPRGRPPARAPPSPPTFG